VQKNSVETESHLKELTISGETDDFVSCIRDQIEWNKIECNKLITKTADLKQTHEATTLFFGLERPKRTPEEALRYIGLKDDEKS
jgi:hypothetical protein